MFEGWSNFYVLMGGAAATLIGIMALVATLTSGSGNPARAERGQRMYLTPTVFHLAAVLTLSALTLAPRQDRLAHTLLIAAPALYGLGYAAVVGTQHVTPGAGAHWSDPWCYGALPLGAYALIVGSLIAATVWHGPGCIAFAASLLVLLLTAIRNAWDLVIWLAPRRETLMSPESAPETAPKPD